MRICSKCRWSFGLLSPIEKLCFACWAGWPISKKRKPLHIRLIEETDNLQESDDSNNKDFRRHRKSKHHQRGAYVPSK